MFTLTHAAFMVAFAHEYELRWVTASREVPAEYTPAALDGPMTRYVCEVIGAEILGKCGYEPGMSEETWAAVVNAVTSDETHMLRIADAVQQKLSQERSFKKFMRPPSFFVGECMRFGCVNLILLTAPKKKDALPECCIMHP